MNIALLYGGASSEHDVSCVSARGLLEELKSLPDTVVHVIGISRAGRWFLQRRPSEGQTSAGIGLMVVEEPEHEVRIVPGAGLEVASTPIAVDCALPVVHGTTGEDGVLQGMLEAASIPYVGSGVAGSAIGMDKTRSKQLWEQEGLPVVPYIYRRATALAAPGAVETLGDEITRAFGFPVFVKPNAGGSSVGITRVARQEQLAEAVRAACAVDHACLIEQALSVREIETAVLGNADPVAFPPGEVVPSHEFYDYEAKYVDPNGARLCIPADLAPALAERVRKICIAAFRAIDAAGFARVDCFVERASGDVYLNEINTLPGFTPISMYPKMAAAGGVSYRALLLQLIKLGRERTLPLYKRG